GVAPAVAAGLLAHPRASAAATVTPALIEAVGRAVAGRFTTATVAALTGSIVRGLALAQLRRMSTVIVILVLGVGSAGLVASYLPGSTSPDDPPRSALVLAAQPASKPPASSRVDLYG